MMESYLYALLSVYNNNDINYVIIYRYRAMVKDYKKAYQTYTRLEKTQLAATLVREWQTQNPPGRFLEKDDATGYWYAITEKGARRKTSQLLREGAPKIRRQIKDESDHAKQQQQQFQLQQHQASVAARMAPPSRTMTDGASSELTTTTTPKPEKAVRSSSNENEQQMSSEKKARTVTPNIPYSKQHSRPKPLTLADRTNSPPSSTTTANTMPPQQPCAQYQYPYYQHPHYQAGYAYGQHQSSWSYQHHQQLQQYDPVPPSPVSVENQNLLVTFQTPPPHYNHSTKDVITPVKVTPEMKPKDASDETKENDSETDSCRDFPGASIFDELDLDNFQPSWECSSDVLDHCDEDIASLMDEIAQEAAAATAANSDSPLLVDTTSKASSSYQDDDVHLLHLSPLLAPRLSPPSNWRTMPSPRGVMDPHPKQPSGQDPAATGSSEQQRTYLLEKNHWASLSFNSLDSVGGLGIDEETGRLCTTTIDILDELDQEMEEEIMLPLFSQL